MLYSFDGKVKITLCKRLGNEWQDLADYFNISLDQRRQFEKGRECKAIWEWLECRNELQKLPQALKYLGREDLLPVFEKSENFCESEQSQWFNNLWNFLDEELQDVLSLAYNFSKRNGSNTIKTKYLFAAIRKLNSATLKELFVYLPNEALPTPPPEDITTEPVLLEENPNFSGCVNASLKSIGKYANDERKLSLRDIFVDLAKYGGGNSVSRLRRHGISSAEIDRIVQELGWSIIERER